MDEIKIMAAIIFIGLYETENDTGTIDELIAQSVELAFDIGSFVDG